MGELKRRQIRAADQLQGRTCFTSAPLGGCSLAQSSAVDAHTNITGVQSQTLLKQQHQCCSLSRKKPTPIQHRHPPGHCSLLASCASWETTALLGAVRRAHHTGVSQTDRLGAVRAGVAPHRRPPVPGARGYLLTPGGPARR